MSDIKELKDEDLNKVTGGSTEENAPSSVKCCGFTFSGFVKKYAEQFVGDYFYLVSHDLDEYYYGRLLDSFEAESLLYTERTQVINCIEYNGASFSGFVEVSGDDYWLYRIKA